MIHPEDVSKAIMPHRGDAIVVCGRSARFWLPISDKPARDVPLGDPAMGGHASFAFGLAMAQPEEQVILLDSEGDVLMNMGALATIAEHAPQNFYHFLLDNECYATTGGQPVPNAGTIRYDVIARGCGYPRSYRFEDLEEFTASVGNILSEPGPVLVHVKIDPIIETLPINQRRRIPLPSRTQVVSNLQQELGIVAGMK